MKAIYILPLFIIIIGCNNQKTENSSSILLKDIQTILPLETDSIWTKADLTNSSNKFNRDTLFNAIKNGILTGNLKAYESYPNKELSINDVKKLLVFADTNSVEDPNNPGTFVHAPIQSEVNGQHDLPFLKFHEDIELDTLTYKLKKKILFVSLYRFEYSTTKVLGTKKLFDVKLNE